MNKASIKVLHVIIITLSMISFGLFSHKNEFLIFKIISISAIIICLTYIITTAKNIKEIIGLKVIDKKTILWLPVCIIFGIGLAVFNRNFQNMSIVPEKFYMFTALSACIGICEELLFRGIVLGKLENFSLFLAVAVSAFSHTMYKCSLFVFPGTVVSYSIFYLGIYTFTVGIIFGLMRVYLRNIIFPIFSHASFDVVSYGDFPSPPWWVW